MEKGQQTYETVNLHEVKITYDPPFAWDQFRLCVIILSFIIIIIIILVLLFISKLYFSGLKVR